MHGLQNKKVKPRDTDNVNILFCLHCKLGNNSHVTEHRLGELPFTFAKSDVHILIYTCEKFVSS